MRRLSFPLFLALSLCFVLSSAARAQDKPAATAPAVPGIRGEFLDELNYYEQRFVRLAEAIPADKYSWKPAEGVRTIGEVYVHMAGSNYGYAHLWGANPPAGVDSKSLAAIAGDKEKAVQALKDSFAFVRSALMSIKDSDLETAVKPNRGPSTIRGTFILLSGHYGEHLGQSIAYARMVGVVPPWTEERQKQEAAKPK